MSADALHLVRNVGFERPALGLAAILLAIAGVAHMRGPDLSVVPEMAGSPVDLTDGTLIYVQKYEVTIAEWMRCHDAGACLLSINPRPGMSAETTPATGLSYVDVGQYVDWVSSTSHHPFRLPTASEWDQMAAGVLPEEPDPIFTDPSLTWASAYLVENLPGRKLEPTGTFPATEEGVFDLTGSVWEWTQDCYSGANPDECPAFWVAGEHLAAVPFLERDPARGGCAVGAPPAHLGLRMVTDKAPPV